MQIMDHYNEMVANNDFTRANFIRLFLTNYQAVYNIGKPATQQIKLTTVRNFDILNDMFPDLDNEYPDANNAAPQFTFEKQFDEDFTLPKYKRKREKSTTNITPSSAKKKKKTIKRSTSLFYKNIIQKKTPFNQKLIFNNMVPTPPRTKKKKAVNKLPGTTTSNTIKIPIPKILKTLRTRAQKKRDNDYDGIFKGALTVKLPSALPQTTISSTIKESWLHT
jgi:hypothetical protein